MMAPEWQALYEIYYTSSPLAPRQQAADGDQALSSTSLNSFTRYYSLKFGKVDCVAFGTACGNAGIKAFPTVVLFKDGEEVTRMKGAHNLKELSGWLEERLESIKPGSRPQGGLLLPMKENGRFDESQKPMLGSDEKPATGSIHSHTQPSAKDTPVKADQAKNSPNPEGLSVKLTRDSFRDRVTSTLEPWFIKFYAPWCPHCQKMAPNWAEMAKEMKGVLNVGEVNCDVEHNLCKDMHAQSYPTILFFRGGERIQYDGLRGVGDFISFATKAVDVGSGVRNVDLAAFENLEETEEVIFVYFYDHAATSEDFAALDRLTLSLVGHARLVKTNDLDLYKRFEVSTWPSLIVSREGKVKRYDGLSPNDMRNVHQILAWMKSVWQPIVPELTGTNARELMSNNIVVLGILSRERPDEFANAKREIKSAAFEWMEREASTFILERDELRNAKQLRIDEAEDRKDERALIAAKQIRLNMDDLKRKKVVFAWVDGIFWQRWVRTTYGVDVTTDGERVIINDEEVRSVIHQMRGNPMRMPVYGGLIYLTNILIRTGYIGKTPPPATLSYPLAALYLRLYQRLSQILHSYNLNQAHHSWNIPLYVCAICIRHILLLSFLALFFCRLFWRSGVKVSSDETGEED